MRIEAGTANNVHYALKDHLGSASVMTDASGNVVGEQRFYPFGETRWSTGSMFTDKLYTGQREMAGLGIYHYGARFYSPKLGRFLSADTIVPGAGNPQAYNRYSYVLNNPLMYIDPSGHKPCLSDYLCKRHDEKVAQREAARKAKALAVERALKEVFHLFQQTASYAYIAQYGCNSSACGPGASTTSSSLVNPSDEITITTKEWSTLEPTLEIWISEMEEDLRRWDVGGAIIGAGLGGAGLGSRCPGWGVVVCGILFGVAVGYLGYRIGDGLGNGAQVRELRDMKNSIDFVMGRAESLGVDQATIHIWQRSDGKVDLNGEVGDFLEWYPLITVHNETWSYLLQAHEYYQGLPAQ